MVTDSCDCRFLLCSFPLLPPVHSVSVSRDTYQEELSAHQSQAEKLTVTAITISNLSRNARNPAVLENAANHAQAPRVLSLCRSWKSDL